MLAKISLKAIIEWLAHYRLLGLAVVGVSFVIATIIVLTGPQAEPQARVEKAWPVSVLVAEPDRKQPVLVAFGKVESRQVANLRTSITAPVAEVVAEPAAEIEPELSTEEEVNLAMRLEACRSAEKKLLKRPDHERVAEWKFLIQD